MTWARRLVGWPGAARVVAVVVLVVAAVLATVPSVRSPHELAPGELGVVALGDSVPTGYGCDCDSFARMVADRLGPEVGRPARLVNEAVNGASSGDVLALVSHTPVVSELRQASLVLLMVGANDVPLDHETGSACAAVGRNSCLAPRLSALRAALSTTVGEVRDASPKSVVALVGYWNVGVDGDEARSRGEDFLANSRSVTRSVNATIADVARSTGSVYVDGAAALLGPDGSRDPTPDLQDDGDHPDESGNQRLAAATMDALATSGALATLRERSVAGR
ncbi:SGNH/GDSL hydrolase family protein [Phycicoccus avicenniae]|uniref:SGNH/GDSL hydrolase family protein n=1 Tax=Phycicoccus avicenniae TaxID=2828860 RepID=UPI003D2E69FD